MLYSTTKAIRLILIKGITRPVGFVVCPAECLVNTQQELHRGRIEPLEPFLADGDLWVMDPKDAAKLFSGVTFDFVKEWSVILIRLERDNPHHPAVLDEKEKSYLAAGREEMISAIKVEALKRRDSKYHNKNQ